MSELVDYLEGVETIIDNILIHRKTKSEHDEQLIKVLKQIKQIGLKLNKEKC